MEKFEIKDGKFIKYNEIDKDEVVIVPEGITVIGEKAFDFSNLYVRELYLPKSLTALEDYSLAILYLVKSLEIPETVEYVGDGAFFGWRSLEKVKIPQKLKKITTEMFGMCDDLKIVEKHNEIDEVGHSAFYDCGKLKKFDFTGVKKIGVYAFYNCKSLKEVILPDTVTEIDECAFESCSGLKKITLSNNIEKIGEYTFWGCKSLTSVEIPKSVKFIGKYAFGECTSLTEIRVPKGCKLNWGWKKGCNAKVVRY